MRLMRRKIDDFLKEWKENEDRLPLIVKGARQIGKTASIMQFANDNYRNVVAINFVLQQKFKSIFDDGYDVDSVVRNITLINPNIELERVSRFLVGINFRHPNVMPNFAVWKTITYRHWHRWCCQPRF